MFVVVKDAKCCKSTVISTLILLIDLRFNTPHCGLTMTMTVEPCDADNESTTQSKDDTTTASYMH